jgi:hypothetical protein
MTEKRWEFELDGTRHTVELEHSIFSNKRLLRVDGRLLPQTEGARHTFRIAEHTCEVVINTTGRKFAYQFLVDGVSNIPEQYEKEMSEAQSSEQMRGMRWFAIIICLLIGIASNWLNWYWAHTQGYYYEELALLAPAIGFLGFYWIFFPKDFVAQYSGISIRMWIVIALALLLGLANMYAFSNGLY